jgi:hypothetical protein
MSLYLDHCHHYTVSIEYVTMYVRFNDGIQALYKVNQNLLFRFGQSVIDSGGMLEHTCGSSFAIKGLPVRSNATSSTGRPPVP